MVTPPASAERTTPLLNRMIVETFAAAATLTSDQAA